MEAKRKHNSNNVLVFQGLGWRDCFLIYLNQELQISVSVKLFFSGKLWVLSDNTDSWDSFPERLIIWTSIVVFSKKENTAKQYVSVQDKASNTFWFGG